MAAFTLGFASYETLLSGALREDTVRNESRDIRERYRRAGINAYGLLALSHQDLGRMAKVAQAKGRTHERIPTNTKVCSPYLIDRST